VVRFPVPDFGVPGDPAAFRALVLDILARLEQGSGVFVHCHAGLGRTGLVLACVLRALGLKRDPVVEVRRIYHRRAVANAWQRVFARTFAPR
jgi:protein-tyrosine phosphatase